MTAVGQVPKGDFSTTLHYLIFIYIPIYVYILRLHSTFTFYFHILLSHSIFHNFIFCILHFSQELCLMSFEYQHLIPEDFHSDSKVWIYQSSRLFTLSEAL